MSIPSSTSVPADPMNHPTTLLMSRSSPLQRFVLSDEEKAQEALFEQAKTLCTNASQKVRCRLFFALFLVSRFTMTDFVFTLFSGGRDSCPS
jgi:hypothetical protein